jgi:aerobic-type carbon monoxide dehydrogenase small subunit (CoxS/CutS family)
MFQIHVRTSINGDDTEFSCEADETLLDVLRDRLGLTGTKGRLRKPAIAAPARCSLMAVWSAPV